MVKAYLLFQHPELGIVNIPVDFQMESRSNITTVTNPEPSFMTFDWEKDECSLEDLFKNKYKFILPTWIKSDKFHQILSNCKKIKTSSNENRKKFIIKSSIANIYITRISLIDTNIDFSKYQFLVGYDKFLNPVDLPSDLDYYPHVIEKLLFI
jgi:hypothetical protein